MAYESVLYALADPTRRAVLEQLRQQPQSVGDLAAELPVSRPAVSQHLKVLKDANLVQEERQGTKRIYHVDAAGLARLQAYLDNMWQDALSAYKVALEQTPADTASATSPNDISETSEGNPS